MKKHLFLLGSFMATSLVTANALLVISCKKKPSSVKENKEDEKDSGQVALAKVTKIKDEIRNIIDDIITNPVDEANEWLIKLDESGLTEPGKIIKFLNDTVESIIDTDKVIDLATLPSLDPDLLNRINDKFTNLKDIIMERIKNMEEELGIFNFSFYFESASIKPLLTSLNGVQVLAAVTKLTKKPTFYDLATSDDSKETINKIDNLDLFKVKTDISYNFKFDGLTDQQQDTYKEAELLLAGNTDDYRTVNRYTQETIKDVLTASKEIKDIEIFNSDEGKAKKIHEYEYIGKQMNWDFSDQKVENEIKQMQYKQLENLKASKGTREELKDILSEMKFTEDKFKFIINDSNYMKFNNVNINQHHVYDTCIICGGSGSGGNPSHEAIERVKKHFVYDGNKTTEADEWNGGVINHGFIEQVKQDGATEDKDGNHIKPKIDLSGYYGFGSNDPADPMLIGYGTTTIRNASYAGISLAKIIIGTNLIAPYGSAGMDDLNNDLLKYVKTIISAIRNENATGDKKDKGIYIIHTRGGDGGEINYQWVFGNDGEWEIIDQEIKRTGEVTFNWIMENVLWAKRMNNGDSSLYKLPKNAGVDDAANIFPRTRKEIKYVQSEDPSKYLFAKDYSNVSAIMYLKYGPFTVYLNDNDAVARWDDANYSTITPEWKGN